MFFDFLPRFARAARAPGFGKRTNRVKRVLTTSSSFCCKRSWCNWAASLIGVREIQRIETDLLKGVCGLSGLFPPEDRT